MSAATDASSSSTTADPTTITPTTSATVDTTGAASTSADASTTDDEVSSTDSGTDTGPSPTTPCAEYDDFASELARVDPGDRTALTESFVAQMQYGEQGLPIRCDGRLVVLAWDESNAALTVTGDFADWDPAAHPLERVVAGFPLLVGDIAVDEPLAPGLYKLVRDGTDYFADPWARRFGWDELGEYSLTAARETASHHERYPAFAEGVGDLQSRDVVVYVPAGAFDAGRDLGVIYMHDGQNLFAPDAFFGGWRVTTAMDDAIAAGDIPPMFVVAIDNTSDRFDEYTQTPDDIGGGPIGGRADEYADFVVLGVKAFIDDRYPTASDAASTAVLGSSLGGLVSLYLGWRHPEVFGFAGSMSGTLGWGTATNDRILELYDQQPPQGVWIYLDSGGAGPCPGGSDNYCANVEMRDRLVDLGWAKSETLVYVHAPGASHDEAAWASRLPGFLAALGHAMSI
jgi:predicted alpha/beta superfamily hydrolase